MLQHMEQTDTISSYLFLLIQELIITLYFAFTHALSSSEKETYYYLELVADYCKYRVSYKWRLTCIAGFGDAILNRLHFVYNHNKVDDTNATIRWLSNLIRVVLYSIDSFKSLSPIINLFLVRIRIFDKLNVIITSANR